MGGSPSLQWEGSARRVAASEYELTLSATIHPSWKVYADQTDEGDLSGPKIVSRNAVVTAKKCTILTPAAKVYDPIFLKYLSVYRGRLVLRQQVHIEGAVPATLRVIVGGYTANDTEFLTFTDTLNLPLEGGVQDGLLPSLLLPALKKGQPLEACGEQPQEAASLLATFLLGLLGGFLALFTPCVFPMIPVTVAFFTGKAETKGEGIRNCLWYGASILLIYLLASLPFHLLTGINPQIFNQLATSVAVNCFFFLVFLLFALSFFGVFEIRLPAAIANGAGARSSLHTRLGIFFLALTLSVVSFSCTGPLLGTLLVGSIGSAGGAWQLTIAMGGFALALALPFTLLALFPRALTKLPKSGAWLQTVKKVLAFVELALALKFLSNADLVGGWGLFKREVFIASWALLAAALGLYLLRVKAAGNKGRGRRDDSPATGDSKPRLSRWRIATGALSLLFALYLLPGLTPAGGANLSLLSGFPPPLTHSIYAKSDTAAHGPAQVVVNDFEKGTGIARQQAKPILVDFTGWACINCRKMEEGVWKAPEVARLMREELVVVSLYVDDRKPLPAAERFMYTTKGGEVREIVTQGDKWSTFQAENFGQLTQPLYVMLSPEGELLARPIGYTASAKEYRDWLQCGLSAYKRVGQQNSN